MAAEMLTILRRPTRLGALALLEAAQLPTADLSDGHLDYFFYLGSPAAPTGSAGCEAYARKQGVRVMYLLTTTAEEFFARRGYSSVDRNQVPDSVRSTSEYSEICLASSAIMVKHL